MKKTILLTGGSGVIGKQLLPKILTHYKIICLGKHYDAFPEEIRFHSNFKFYERDLNSIHSSDEFQIPEKIDLILHMAAVVSGSSATSEEYSQINVHSTKHLFEFGKLKKIKRFGFISSVSVYGGKNTNLHFSSDRQGTSIYARTKKEAEDYLLPPINKSNFPFSIIRLASVYGQGSKSFISKLESLGKRGIFPKTQTDRKKSIVHVDDVVSFLEVWIEEALSENNLDPIYVLSEPEFYSIGSVIQILKEEKRIPTFAFGLAVDGILGKLIECGIRFLYYVKKRPYHNSPLLPILESVAIYDENSWRKLGIFPKWNLRKEIQRFNK